ncbi:Quino protein alcohol dehydrogenase-like protein [Cladorrhinum samala]|uniref:Quino protein alcohol dehydrogenase-like protein n=1 Tax=Cladorrhinum samala TaxID=585594 RepID=A0AAV9H859_9PEZI|nr:Quino protein alcohol dehydrogenase-like protein [Cladorrhinum samala]
MILFRFTSVLLTAAALFPLDAAAGHERPWLGWGGNRYNNRWASTNTRISSDNIAKASIHCQLPAPGGTSATPTVVQGIAYFPIWNGSLVALDYSTCRVKWQINVSQIITDFAPLTPMQKALVCSCSRTSPSVDLYRGIIYFATQAHALVVAADLNTGRVLGRKQINSHPLAQITLSGTLLGDTYYTGVSSAEEGVVGYTSNYTCCTFVGNAAAVRFSRSTNRFTTLWDVPMLPADDPSEPGLWSGAGVWGSAPAIDLARNQVYYATGNLYSVPTRYIPCTAEEPAADPPPGRCTLPARVWQESVIALDLETGRPGWVRQLGALDAWTLACAVNPKNEALCPATPGPDADFGMAPAFVPSGGRDGKDVLVIGQKNGNLYSLSADTGRVKWATAVGPGGVVGGLMWGVAVDDSGHGGRVYFVENNSEGVPWRPQPANDTVITNSAYGAASLLSGEVVWQTPALEGYGAINAPTVVGDVVLAGRQSVINLETDLTALRFGALVALKTTTGQILLDMPLDAYFQSGISVFGNYIFFGTGYHELVNGSFYVLSVM